MLTQAAPADTLRVIRCSIAAESYGLDLANVLSIQRADMLRRGGGTAPALGHILSPNGPVAVFALTDLLGRSSQPALDSAQVVVIRAEGKPWGLLVDRVSPVLHVASRQLLPLPSALPDLPCFFRGVLALDSDLLLLLAPQHLHPDAWLNEPAPLARCAFRPGAHRPSQTSTSVQPRSGPRRLLLCRLNEPHNGTPALALGLSMAQVLDIREPLPLTAVPAAPDHVLGLVHWRNRAVPVVHMRQFLGLSTPSQPETASRLLITRLGDQNGVLGLLTPPSLRILPLPQPHRRSRQALGVDSGRVREIIELKNETVIFPDFSSI